MHGVWWEGREFAEVSRNPLIADYPMKRGEEKSCLGVYKIWEGVEAKELGNKKLEPWKHWLVFIAVPYRNQSCFQGGLRNFVGNEDAIYGAILEGPLPGPKAE